MSMLPEILPSSAKFATIASGPLKGVPVCGVLGTTVFLYSASVFHLFTGDQQASLVGQQCLSAGQAKCTYGTGVFLLYNTGNSLVFSKRGLLTTIAYQWSGSSPMYALEGSGSIGGSAVRWLRDNLSIIKVRH